jgi:tryptophan synthase alpha chain
VSDRYRETFARLAAEGDGAFVPFVVLGDPTWTASLAAIEALVAGGADALELGIPFSDPVADGPTIQAAVVRALADGMTPTSAFALLTEVRSRYPSLPLGLLVYANLVEARGAARFYADAARAGVDSVLIADVPTLEAEPFCAAAEAAGVDPVLIATPNAAPAALERIARLSRGYTYVVSRRGVTGAQQRAGSGHESTLAALAAAGAPPCLVGFGISAPDHVTAACRSGAAGAIAGSAVVALVERHLGDVRRGMQALVDFTRAMKAATVGARAGASVAGGESQGTATPVA